MQKKILLLGYLNMEHKSYLFFIGVQSAILSCMSYRFELAINDTSNV